MKTNNVITRPMGGFSVTQRTKDGMFNATDLLKQWNFNTQNSGGLKSEYAKPQKQIVHYTDNRSTEEYISTIMARESKQRNSVIIKTRGKNGGTWMHPMLFLDFAMWLNPTFKYDVIKFIQDKMLEYRNENCEAYKQLSVSLSKIVDKTLLQNAIRNVAKALNIIVFGKHEQEARNKNGVEEQQKELWQLERSLSTLIDDKFIKSYEQLMEYLRSKWREKYQPQIFNTTNSHQ